MTSYIIIGPANYILEKENKNYIDSFDKVIRIKSGYPIPKELEKNLGSRTDILYTNLVERRNNLTKENLNLIKKNNIKLKYPFPILDNYDNLDLNDNIRIIYNNFIKKNNLNIETLKLDIYNNIFIYLNKRPSILPLIITDILNQNADNKITLLGFTFRLNWLINFNVLDGTYSNYYRNYNDIASSYAGIKYYNVHDIQKEYEYIKSLKNITIIE